MPHTANCHVLEAGSRKCLVFFLKNYKKALQINILLIINESSYYWSSSPNYTEKRDAKEKSLDLWIETIADSLKSRMTLTFPPYTNLALWIKKLSKTSARCLILVFQTFFFESYLTATKGNCKTQTKKLISSLHWVWRSLLDLDLLLRLEDTSVATPKLDP